MIGWRLVLMTTVLALAGCHHQPEAEPGPDDNSSVAANDTIATPTPTPEPTATPSPTPVADAPPPPRVTHDQQMQDDADATGMTARLSDNDAAEPADDAAGAVTNRE